MLQCVVTTVVTAAGGVYVMCELQLTLMLVDIQSLASASVQLGERSIRSRSRCDQLYTCCKTHVCTVMYNKLKCRTSCKYAAEGIALLKTPNKATAILCETSEITSCREARLLQDICSTFTL